MKRFTERLALIVFATTYVAAAALYVASAAKAPGSGDWGDFVAAASVLGIAHPTGYPVYLQILALPLLILPAAWAAAVADVANALLVASAPALLALWAYRVARGDGRDDAGVGAFAVLTGVFFAGTTSVEVYGAALALLLGALLLLEPARRGGDDRPFLAAALLGGLAAGVHLTAFSYVFVLLIIWVVARRPAFRTVCLGAAAWALGLAAALYLPLRTVAAPPLTWSWTGPADLRTTFLHAAGRQFSYNFRVPTWLLAGLRLRELGAALWANGGPFLLLAPLGIWIVWRRSRAAAAAVSAVFALNVAFLLFYDIPDLGNYQLPFVGFVFACAAAAAVALFGRAGGKFRAVIGAVAAVGVAFSLACEWPRQRRDTEFISYYAREIVLPVGYRAVYVSGTTSSNFLYWFRQYTLGRRADVELYNVNDFRYDIVELAGLMGREVGARPVFADYLFVFQTQERQTFCRRGRPAGFIFEMTARDTTAADPRPLDGEVLSRAEKLIRARRHEEGRPKAGLDLAIDVWGYYGFFYEYRDDRRRARYYFVRAAELAPEIAIPQINLARWYLADGECDDARLAARAAISTGFDANTYVAYGYLAMVDQAQGDLDRALEYARVAAALKPHDGKTHRLLAGIYLERRDSENAKRELEKTLACDYKDPVGVLILAMMYGGEGREEEAFRLLAENVHEYDFVPLINAYASALIARGRYVEAKAELMRAVRIAPNSPEVRANLARLEAMGW